MKVKRNFLVVAAVLASLLILVGIPASTARSARAYEVETGIATPEYKTDTARAIDAYERLMDRYLGLTEGNLTRTGSDIQTVIKKLDAMNEKLSDLSTRIARIEVSLGLQQSAAPQKPQESEPKQKPQP